MAPRKPTRHGASASTRRTARSTRGGRGSAARTRTSASPRTAAPGRSSSTRRTRRPRWVTPLVLLATLALMAWAFYTPLRLSYQESREQARLEAELAALKERNEQLAAQVDRLQTPEGVEEVARENLGMVKEGEHAYVVLDPSADTTTPAAPRDEAALSTDSLWTSVLDLIFGVR